MSTVAPLPMFTLNPNVPKADALDHASCLLDTAQGLMRSIGCLTVQDIPGADVRTAAWAAYYLTELAAAITDGASWDIKAASISSA